MLIERKFCSVGSRSLASVVRRVVALLAHDDVGTTRSFFSDMCSPMRREKLMTLVTCVASVGVALATTNACFADWSFVTVDAKLTIFLEAKGRKNSSIDITNTS